MFKISSQLRNDLLDSDCLAGILSGLNPEIRIYAGTEPASPDDAIGSATLLCTITGDGVAGTDLTFETDAVNGVLSKDSTQIWKGSCVAGGTATFYRMVSHSDTGNASTTAVRVQGSVGTVNADLLLASTLLAVSQEQRIDYFAIGMPGS